MDKLTGIIDKYRFYSDDTGYSVIVLEEGNTVVGNLPKLNPGDKIEMDGFWIHHKTYGRQFKVEKFSILYPTTKSGIVKYLASGFIKGIGEATAHKIVSHFGDRTLDIFDSSIERLLEIDGIGKVKLAVIKKGWDEAKGIKNVMIFLQSHNISTSLSMKIYKAYGNDSEAILRKDPYRIIFDIWGAGFKTADQIGKSLGFYDHHPQRVKAGIVYILSEASRSGHLFLSIEELETHCRSILGYELVYDDPLIDDLVNDSQIVVENGNVYNADLYFAERSIEKRIKSLNVPPRKLELSEQKAIDLIAKRFSDEQIGAIRKSMENKLLIITGGPGTGKTTTLRGIIKIFERENKKILLTAPTGRAAKRMTEVIGLEAKTIHRLLGYIPNSNEFNHNSDNPLVADLIVVDEVSMIDTFLMYHLISAVQFETTLIFVGDVDQLPSVGPGNILNDLIESKILPTVQLTQIFRQAEKSKIIQAAHNINKGVLPNLDYDDQGDILFVDENDNQRILDYTLELIKNRLPKRFDFDPLIDIQVLSPMYKGDLGVTNLNELLQRELNNSEKDTIKGSKGFKINDKVMQLRNNYDKNVFNGDIGFIANYDYEKEKVFVNFEGRYVSYDLADLDELVLAYAITIHKSQGSEFPCILMPVVTSHFIMLQRNLLYTAITRAKDYLVVIGTKQAVSIAVNNNKVKHRNTSLFK